MTLRFGVHSSGKMASRNLEGIIIAPTGYKFRLHPEGHKIRQAAQLSFIWLLGLLLAANVSPVAAAGSLQAEVLTLRHRPDSQKINASPSIDPFNWSKKQTAEFRERVPLVKSSAAAGLTLNAIIWGPQQALAVINGRITEKGNRVTLADDQHRQATILTIMADKMAAKQAITKLPGTEKTHLVLLLAMGFTSIYLFLTGQFYLTAEAN